VADPIDALLSPFAKTGRYYAGAWKRYRGGAPSTLPLARPTLRLAAHALRDEIVLSGLRTQRPLSAAGAYGRIDREVADALEFYGANGWLDHPERFFAAPPPVTDLTAVPVTQGRRSYQRFFFDSGYRPAEGEPGGDRWRGYTGNDKVYGLMLRHRETRPWLMCVHGLEMGRAGVDLTLFRAWHLHQEFGLNVVLPVHPMHGPRARGLPRGKAFPGEDVMDNVHFAAQAVWDVRRLLAWIRATDPGAPIGLNAISMGGYVSALVASLEDDLVCAILGVPVSDLLGLLDRHSGFGPQDPRRRTMERAEPIGQMVSPLSLTPRVPMRGRFIYGGVADRLVHPREQVERLWEHWGKPEIVWYQGGHTGFFGRPVQRFIDAALVQSGLV
jgi:hypothetical protein